MTTEAKALLEKLKGYYEADHDNPKLRADLATVDQALAAARAEGIEEGIRKYAWWEDGEQFVGTCGTTLKKALEACRQQSEEGR